MGGDLPKQFIEVNGRPLLAYTLVRIRRFCGEKECVVVMNEDWIDHWQELCERHQLPQHVCVKGGKERFHSVAAGLEQVSGELVGIHDAVRPLVSDETIERCFSAAEVHGGAVPVVQVNESLREVTGDENRAVPRSRYRIVQTPQCFQTRLIKRAFEQGYREDFTDDASVFEAAGHRIALVEGNVENIKVTTPQDLLLAEHYLR
jgi:2-C-methyl-D-erythritol 4-phosphate cytidylyltransferase